MTKLVSRGFPALLLFTALAVFASGCNKTDGTGSGPVAENKNKEKDKGKDNAEEKDDHSGWWCKEHGIPEEECSMCSDDYAKKCKEKGDWCKEHDRAESQCFICHPEYKEKFAAKYRAKFGTEPPPIKDKKLGKQ